MTSKRADSYRSRELPPECEGMTLREYYAAHAPFTLADVRPLMAHDASMYKYADRAQAMRILAQLRFEYADEMIKRNNQS